MELSPDQEGEQEQQQGNLSCQSDLFLLLLTIQDLSLCTDFYLTRSFHVFATLLPFKKKIRELAFLLICKSC